MSHPRHFNKNDFLLILYKLWVTRKSYAFGCIFHSARRARIKSSFHFKGDTFWDNIFWIIASCSWANLLNLDVIMNYIAGQQAPQANLGQRRNRINTITLLQRNQTPIKSNEKLPPSELPILVGVGRQYNQFLQI